MALSAAVAVGAVWIGLMVSYAAPDIPPSFAILSVTTGGYAAVLGRDRWRGRRDRGSTGGCCFCQSSCQYSRSTTPPGARSACHAHSAAGRPDAGLRP